MILSNCGIPYKAAIAKDWNYKPRNSPFLKKKNKKQKTGFSYISFKSG